MAGTQTILRRFTLRKIEDDPKPKSKPFVSIPSDPATVPKHHQIAFWFFFFIEEVPNYFWPIWANPRRQQRSWKKNCRENNFFRPGSQQRQLLPLGRFSVLLLRRWQVFPCKRRLSSFLVSTVSTLTRENTLNGVRQAKVWRNLFLIRKSWKRGSTAQR